MVSNSDRLDAHDQQLSQLQSTVSSMQVSLETVHSEVADLKKLMISWMNKHEKQPETSAMSLPPGGGGVFNSGETAGPSSPRFGFSGNSKSVSNWDFGPKSACDGDLSGGKPFQAAQLEAIVARSDERRSKHEQLMSTIHPDSHSSGDDPTFPAPGTLLVPVRFKGEEILVGQGPKSCPVVASIPKLGPDEVIIPSQQDLFDIEEKLGSHSDPGVDISNLGLARPTPPISGFTNFDIHDNNPQSEKVFHWTTLFVPHIHSSQYKIGRELSVVQIVEWKPGRDFGWLDYTRPPTFASKLFVLDDEPKPPDPSTNLKPDLLWKLFHGWCKTASQVAAGVVGSYHLWVVHGQGRPPEDTNRTISTLDLKSVSRFQS